ncbi:MAG: circularly permuted type 2 ATP-grasp protein, partial [Verrucomicrobiota bacterium]|nr:circularly permuted type 2 ATP-grasp protein [Verrucomicrobiota bacterium]
MNFNNYSPENYFDEYFLENNIPRKEASLLVKTINSLDEGDLKKRQEASEVSIRNMGITFKLNDNIDYERTIPFDIIPRVISGKEWDPVEKGLAQRIKAINLFIDDIYNDQEIIKDNLIPSEIIKSSKGYRSECEGLKPPNKVWAHVTGT